MYATTKKCCYCLEALVETEVKDYLHCKKPLHKLYDLAAMRCLIDFDRDTTQAEAILIDNDKTDESIILLGSAAFYDEET